MEIASFQRRPCRRLLTIREQVHDVQIRAPFVPDRGRRHELAVQTERLPRDRHLDDVSGIRLLVVDVATRRDADADLAVPVRMAKRRGEPGRIVPRVEHDAPRRNLDLEIVLPITGGVDHQLDAVLLPKMVVALCVARTQQSVFHVDGHVEISLVPQKLRRRL